jgi:hypothetical protein
MRTVALALELFFAAGTLAHCPMVVSLAPSPAAQRVAIRASVSGKLAKGFRVEVFRIPEDVHLRHP